MLIYAMLLFIGRALSAPVWYWVCWGLGAYVRITVFLAKLIKAGTEQ